MLAEGPPSVRHDPIQLFSRHATAQAELALVTSLVGGSSNEDLAYDLLV